MGTALSRCIPIRFLWKCALVLEIGNSFSMHWHIVQMLNAFVCTASCTKPLSFTYALAATTFCFVLLLLSERNRDKKQGINHVAESNKPSSIASTYNHFCNAILLLLLLRRRFVAPLFHRRRRLSFFLLLSSLAISKNLQTI